MSVNKVILIGRLGQDPELKHTPSGAAVCNFSLAVNHYSRDDSDPKVSYIEVEAWEKLAEICGEYITKGKWVIVIGELRQERWQGEDGKGRSKLKIIASEVRLLASYANENDLKTIDVETTVAV